MSSITTDIRNKQKESRKLKDKHAAFRDVKIERLEEIRNGLIKMLRHAAVHKGNNDRLGKSTEQHIMMNILRFQGPSTPIVAVKRSLGKNLFNLTRDSANTHGIQVYKTLKITNDLLVSIEKGIKEVGKMIKTKCDIKCKSTNLKGIRGINLVHPLRLNNALKLIALLMSAIGSDNRLGTDGQNQGTVERINGLISSNRLAYTSSNTTSILSFFPSMYAGRWGGGDRRFVDNISTSGMVSVEMIISLFITAFVVNYANSPDAISGTNYNIFAIKEFLNNHILTGSLDDMNTGFGDILRRIVTNNYDAGIFSAAQGAVIDTYPDANPKSDGYVSGKYLLSDKATLKPDTSNHIGKFSLGISPPNAPQGVVVYGYRVVPKAIVKSDLITLRALGFTFKFRDNIQISFNQNGTVKDGGAAKTTSVQLVKAHSRDIITSVSSLSDLNQYLNNNNVDLGTIYVAIKYTNNTNFDVTRQNGTSVYNFPGTQDRSGAEDFYGEDRRGVFTYTVLRKYKGGNTKYISVSAQNIEGVTSPLKLKNIVNILVDSPNVIMRDVTDMVHYDITFRSVGRNIEYNTAVFTTPMASLLVDVDQNLTDKVEDSIKIKALSSELGELSSTELVDKVKTTGNPSLVVQTYKDFYNISTSTASKMFKQNVSSGIQDQYADLFGNITLG